VSRRIAATARRPAGLLATAAFALLALLPCGPAGSQEGAPPAGAASEAVEAGPTALDPANLEPGWWQPLQADDGDMQDRVAALLDLAAQRAAALPDDRRDAVQPALDRLRASLRGYLRLRERQGEEPPRASTLKERYSLDELLAADRELRQVRTLLEGDLAELESRRQSVDALSRQTDSRFAAYLGTAPRSAGRVVTGIEVMALRAGFLLEQQQVRLLAAQVETRRVRVSQLEEEGRAARERLALEETTADALQQRIDEAGRKLTAARRSQREAEAALIDLVATAAPDSAGVVLARQQARLESVREAIAEVELKSLEARLDLLTLEQDPGDDTVSTLTSRRVERRQVLERVDGRLRGWRDAAETGLSDSAPAAAGESEREMLERRAAIAAAMIGEIQRLRRSVGDLVLLQELVSARLVQRQGRLLAFLSDAGGRIADGWDTLRQVATASIVTVGDTPITLAGIFRVLVVLTVAFWVSRILRAALNRMGASRRTAMSASSLYSLGRLLHYVIIIAGIIIGLSTVGLDFTNLALVASALGVGIGFGLQSVVSNFVSGLILLFERSLNVGDFVELDSGVTGMIKEINVRSTLLNTNDNVDILVPNSEFVNGRLINWTLREAVKRVHVSFGVAYGTDKDLTRKAALEAAERVPLTLTGPGREPQVWLVNFGDSSLDYELVVWLRPDAVRRPAAVQAAYLWEIETSLAEHGIEIPFPQRDIHFRSGMDAFGKPEGN